MSSETNLTPIDNLEQFERIDTFVLIKHGEYWRKREDGSCICIISDVHVVEQRIHAVSVSYLATFDEAKGCLKKNWGDKILIDDFTAAYEPCPKPVAAIDDNIKRVQGRIAGLSQEFSDTLSTAPSLPQPALTSDEGVDVEAMKGNNLAIMQGLTEWQNKSKKIQNEINNANSDIAYLVEEKTDMVQA